MSFLSRIAHSYFTEYGDRLRILTFVFPNRRAGIFFRRHLAREAGRPVFSPRILTIEQLFEEFSVLQLADPTDLLFRLYEIYRDVYLAPRGEDETFDSFVFWGRMMLSDFNETDMHLADAARLFGNLSDLKDIELRFADMGKEQQESLNAFIKGFHSGSSNTYREKFLHLWRALLPIYLKLRESLIQDSLAYEGMLCREVVENPQTLNGRLNGNRFVFVGFNALRGAERELMKQLQAAGAADFCWDYGHLFLRDSNNRASLFMEENLKLFPNREGISLEDNRLPEIHLVQIPSAMGQATCLTALLRRIDRGDDTDWTQTCIVLPDERMLTAVRNAIPACVKNINITMGQSLAATPVVSLLQHLSELQLLRKGNAGTVLFYYRPVLALMSHPYIACLLTDKDNALSKQMQVDNMTYVPQSHFAGSSILSRLFVPQNSVAATLEWLRQLMLLFAGTETDARPEQQEYIYRTLLQINRLAAIINSHPAVSLNTKTLFSLLISLVAAVRVPFEGEPLAGLQIMGMLESRGIDFKNIFLTDVNDDTLPGKNMPQTYIPYDLRNAYGLPTPEHQDAVFAYNFYRLISTAEHVWLLQNTTADDMRSGEQSRYVCQLQYQYNIRIDRLTVNAVPATHTTAQMQVIKDDKVQQELRERLCPPAGMEKGHGLSPSALNTYVQCPLRFYLQYVRGMREADKIDENIEDNVFGTVLHNVMQGLYTPFIGATVNAADIDGMKSRVPELVQQHYRKLQLKNATAQLEGKDMLPVHVLDKYICKVLDYDRTIAPFRYIGSEMDCRARITVPGVGEVLIKGIIDRLDECNGYIRVIDYKTGSQHSIFESVSVIYDPAKCKDSDHARQTLAYCFLYEHDDGQKPHNMPLSPHIYYVKEPVASIDTVIAPKKSGIHSYNEMRSELEMQLNNLLADIFDPSKPFAANKESLDNKGSHCAYCPFIQLCF